MIYFKYALEKSHEKKNSLTIQVYAAFYNCKHMLEIPIKARLSRAWEPP